MCGICGIVSAARDKSELTLSMLELIKHRGPDRTDSWSDDFISLGHNRLSILDLSESGSQPMFRENLGIVFNGEIYNYKELRQELMSGYGQSFKTATDTEVILAAWQSWGPEKTLDKLRGMWAFALYDRNTGKLTLSRDRFGIKPLYYYSGKDRFLFASEIKALLAAPEVPRKACLPVLSDYLVAGLQDHTDKTFFKDIMQLPPGHSLEMNVRNGRSSLIRRYDLDRAIAGRKTSVEEFGAVFKDSVRLHLRSDVPVGTCLSGGLDSSSVATVASALMKSAGQGQFQAVTAQSGDPRNDETSYARAVVENSGLRWHLAAPSQEDFRTHWERCLWHQEEPTGGPSVFMQYWVLKTAKEAGLIVMLDGQGGDEALLGYERYYPTLFLEWLRRGCFGTAAAEFFAASRHSKLSLRELALYSVYFLFSGPRKLRLKHRLPDFPPELLAGTFSMLEELTRSFHRVDTMQSAEITRFQLPHLLKYEDRNSMAWSVEARVPLVDHETVEAALTLRPEDKIRDGYTKWALRKTMDGSMPDSITWRRNKTGFEAPTGKWLDSDDGWAGECIKASALLKELHCPAETDDKNLLTLFLNIAQWEKIYKVSL